MRGPTDILQKNENVDVKNIFAVVGELARQHSKVEQITYNSHNTVEMLKDNLYRLLMVGGAGINGGCSFLALEAGSSDVATCAFANDTALDTSSAIAEDWDSLKSTVYLWGLIGVIVSITTVAIAMCGLPPSPTITALRMIHPRASTNSTR